MRDVPVELDELKTNFEAALIAAEHGVPPSTGKGFDGYTFDALWHLASGTAGQKGKRATDARRAFADQLAGNNVVKGLTE